MWLGFVAASGFPRAQRGLAGADHDPEEPGGTAGQCPPFRRLLGNEDEDGLGDVLGEVVIPRPAPGRGIDPVHVPACELLKGAGVSRTLLGDEFCIGLGVHFNSRLRAEAVLDKDSGFRRRILISTVGSGDTANNVSGR
jgi:hypothetical protein